MATSYSGASVGVRVPEPAVDLAPLVQHLAASIPLRSSPHPKFPATGQPFITWDPKERVLILDTCGVLTRLRTSDANKALRGFLVDADVPRAAARAHLGGVIKPGTEGKLRDATARLVAAIDEQIEGAVGAGFDPALLVTTPASTVLDILGKRLGCDPRGIFKGRTRIARTRIEAVGGSQAQRRDEVARIMDAVEEVDGSRETHVDNLFASIEARLRDEGHNLQRLTAALQYHRQSAEKSGTQLDRFFAFLENEALARVRTQVGSHIMEALAGEAEGSQRARPNDDWALLATYVRRAVGLLAALTAAETPAVRINLSAEYGQQASFNLRDLVLPAGLFAGKLARLNVGE